ncbi:hypothetical protein [Nonomuraea sp. NPDC049646]|uniref:hypothetical protein n=1 Tax=unclassified Nonomuraea TaxID=2593643 RepID=UPI00378C36CD
MTSFGCTRCGVVAAPAPTSPALAPQFNAAMTLHDRAETLAAELRRYHQELPERLTPRALRILSAASTVDQAAQDISSHLVDLTEHLLPEPPKENQTS